VACLNPSLGAIATEVSRRLRAPFHARTIQCSQEGCRQSQPCRRRRRLAQLATNGAGVYNPHDRGRLAAVRGVHRAAEPLPASERGIGAGGADGRGLRYAMADERKIRVLVAKPGLDGHDRGAKVIARALRDAGMEVIYTGIRQTPQMIVEAAIQEDVDAILMSILSGAHMAIFPKVMEQLRANGVDDVLVMAGGILPDEDLPAIEALGIKGNFGPGTPMSAIIEYVRANVYPDRLAQALPPLTRAAPAADAKAVAGQPERSAQ
jgi:methylmalonyl-CoA mutase C-terminal domain/subunit